MSKLEVLEAARELIADPERWCQGSLARRHDGLPVGFTSTEAVRWCAFGALARTCMGQDAEDFTSDALRALNESSALLGKSTIVILNDSQDHARVLEAYDLAIAKAREPR